MGLHGGVNPVGPEGETSKRLPMSRTRTLITRSQTRAQTDLPDGHHAQKFSSASGMPSRCSVLASRDEDSRNKLAAVKHDERKTGRRSCEGRCWTQWKV
ncbi:hypothetical protein PZA11_006848 [Diplocarpon coronariae]